MKYGNDIHLTEYARESTNQMASINEHLRDGYLDAAFLGVQLMYKKLEKLQGRLNDIKYGRA